MDPAEPTGDPRSVGSHFGAKLRPTKEIIGFAFCILNPLDRVVRVKHRNINLPFALANCVWAIMGLDNLDFINHYNSRGSSFSDDQQTLHGAHGKRLFAGDGVDQIRAAIARLKKDLFSRRAVATIYLPADAIAESRDIPCPIAIQFLCRAGALSAVTFMRSQSACMVMPYDLFLFTFLQEIVAVELGVKVGPYFHLSGSFHYYLDEEHLVERILSAHDENSPRPTPDTNQIPQMPIGVSPFDMIIDVYALEQTIRKGHLSFEDAQEIPLPYYWKHILLILGSQTWRNVDQVASLLPPYYYELMRA